MGNTSELLINVVSITVPNLLIGINQKGDATGCSGQGSEHVVTIGRRRIGRL
jgi:hypothetical protein